MTAGNWVLLGWFIGVPGILLGLWVGQVGPAAEWDWDIVMAPWWIGILVLGMLWQMGAFDKE